MKNTIRFICSSVLILFMLSLTIIFYVLNQQLLLSAVVTIFLAIMFIANVYVFSKYAYYKRFGDKKYSDLIEIFIKRWFSIINFGLILLMVVTSIIAITEFLSVTINDFMERYVLYTILEVIVIPLLVVETSAIFGTLKEYHKLKKLFV